MFSPDPTVKDLHTLYDLLLKQHGPRNWWPLLYDDEPFEVVCGSLLTQNTAWTNAVKSLQNMHRAGAYGWQPLSEIADTELRQLINPSGFQRAKARKLKEFARLVTEGYGSDINLLFKENNLRNILLKVWGIGPETADAIMLYGARRPSFVCDKYTQRIFTRLGWQRAGKSYHDCRATFMNLLPHETKMFGEYHALIVRHGGKICTKTNPNCNQCALTPHCPKNNIT